MRFGDREKVFLDLAGRPLLLWSVECFASHPAIDRVVVVLGEHTIERGRALLDSAGNSDVMTCLGGAERSDSMRAGLMCVPDANIVLVHDAARPLLSEALVTRVIAAAQTHGAAIPVLPISDTLHRLGPSGQSAGVVDRSQLAAAQTPQAARREWLLSALTAEGSATDEGGMLHAAGYPVALVEGDPRNIKITWPFDLAIARAIVAATAEGAS
ncbi:MAG: 2-C-methyl-D-erythritol 4-phosphate cytidylyltransferase [Thermomicrobiales bacterium]|nr:2-C-methyl-D-erythritol 4-phosphate cytidylyltransferase [Thermomicrobiales bacterium]